MLSNSHTVAYDWNKSPKKRLKSRDVHSMVINTTGGTSSGAWRSQSDTLRQMGCIDGSSCDASRCHKSPPTRACNVYICIPLFQHVFKKDKLNTVVSNDGEKGKGNRKEIHVILCGTKNKSKALLPWLATADVMSATSGPNKSCANFKTLGMSETCTCACGYLGTVLSSQQQGQVHLNQK